MLATFLKGASSADGRVQFVSVAQTQNPGTSTTITISTPSDTQEGNLLVAFLGAATTTVSYTLPSGWVSLNNATGRLLAYKVATSSEPSSYTFTISASTNYFGGCIANIKNGAYDAHSSFGASANPSVASSITLSSNNSLVLASPISTAPDASGLSYTFPAGWNTVITESDERAPSYAVAEKYFDSGSTGNISISSTANSRACLIGIKPA
jgi:hypothetical protein